MGMDQRVRFPDAVVPGWVAVRDTLAGCGYPVQLRMIDGELSFPDELPAQMWQELRVGTPQGMVTVRRESGQVALVTWGNADAAMLEAWNALTWAFARAGGGQVLAAEGAVGADAFRRTADLPAVLRSEPSG